MFMVIQRSTTAGVYGCTVHILSDTSFFSLGANVQSGGPPQEEPLYDTVPETPLAKVCLLFSPKVSFIRHLCAEGYMCMGIWLYMLGLLQRMSLFQHLVAIAIMIDTRFRISYSCYLIKFPFFNGVSKSKTVSL
ncbi:UNVERIFIED_CONTAM: hypothetical protein HHA_203685 [Hammondia hammondi]|eukprot:XP_008884647.1 hypothetical protein HHA_203685 [Hammondia hammondi]